MLNAPRTDSTYARHIGRVGALAVALGIGAAVATGQAGYAWADETSGSNENTSAPDASADAPAGDPAPEMSDSDNDTAAEADVAAEPEGGMNLGSSGGLDTSVNDDGQATDGETGEGEDVAHDEPETPQASSTQANSGPEEAPSLASASPDYAAQQKNSSSEPSTNSAPTVLAASVVQPSNGTMGDSSVRSADSSVFTRLSFATGSESTSTLGVGQKSAVENLSATTTATTEESAKGLPGRIINLATSIIKTFLSPFIGTGPTAPAEPPLLWVVLGFVQRELRTFFNRTPDAVADHATTGQEDTPVMINVLANDKDDDALKVTAVTQAVHGMVTINPNGTLTYTPTANYSGADSFTYTVSDESSPFHLHGLFGLFGRGHTDKATVTVNVAPVNDSPVADDDSYAVSENGTLEVTAAEGLLNGDTDVDSAAAQLTAILGTGPAHGTLTLNPSGSFTYQPAENYSGVDSFTYRVTDGTALSNYATVSITVAPGLEHGPVAGDPAFTIDRIGAANGVVTGRVHATDADNDALTYTLDPDFDSELGTVEVDSVTGEFTFTPTPTARLDAWRTTGAPAASFTVTVSDGETTADITVIAPITSAAHSAVDTILGAEQESWGNQGLAVGPDGRFYMTTYMVDGTVGEVVVLNPDGTHASTISISEAIPYPYATAYDVVVGPDGRVFVSGEAGDTAEAVSQETGRGVLVVIDPANDYSVNLLADLDNPASAIAVDGVGRLYVANWNNDTITVLNSDGSLHDVVESAAVVTDDDSGVAGLAVAPDGTLYLTKPQLGVVKVINADGSTARILDLGGEPWSIALASNGLTYITDFDDARVIGLDSGGNVVRSVGLGYEVSPSDITTTEDGRIYVSYMTANGGAIAIITAVPVAERDASAVGEAIVGSPAGGAAAGPVVGTRVIYQTFVDLNATSGEPTTTVAVIAADGTTMFVSVPGQAVGKLVLGPDDVGYQTVQRLDEATGAYQTGVLLVTSSGSQSFSGWFSGEPAENVVFGAGDVAYQVVSSVESDSDSYTTTVVKISPADVTSFTIDGFAGGLSSSEPRGLVTGPDGTLYLTTTGTPTGETGPVTTLTVIGPDGVTSHSIAGMASGSSTVANGAVLQTVARMNIGSDGESASFTAVVAVLTDSGFVALEDTVDGLPLGSPVVAANGSVYQTVVNPGASIGEAPPVPITSIAMVGATGLSLAFAAIPGAPLSPDGHFMPLVAGPNGAVYQATYGYAHLLTGEPATVVAGLTASGTQFGAMMPGQPVGAVVPVGDDVAIQTTYDHATGMTSVAVITSAGFTMHEFDGYPGNPAESVITPPVAGPDGTAYLTLGMRDPITLDPTTSVVIVSADSVSTVSYDGFPSGTVIVGPDGSVYQTVGTVDLASQAIYVQVLAVDVNGLTPVGESFRGNPLGSAVFGPDGKLYQSALSDDGAGSFVTTVHVVDMSAPVAGRMMAGLQRTAAVTSFTASYIRTIDDAYLAPFNAADPTWRFSYTRTINAQRGVTVDLTPMSDAALVKWVNDYVGNTGTGSQGFSRDSQGRITYRNTTSQDVLVAYGARPDQPAQGAVVARPGATVTLPAGPEGRVAAAQFASSNNFDTWIAIAYRGATPVPTTQPKTGISLASTNSVSYRTSAVDLAGRLPNSDEVKIDIVRAGGTTKMVVYMGGTIPPDLGRYIPWQIGASWAEAYRVRYYGEIPARVSSAIDKAQRDYRPTEIMLVGHSKGGMIAQNYAEHGQYKDKVKVIVTYGSPIYKWPSERYQAIHLNDRDDLIPYVGDLLAFGANAYVDRVYVTPPTNVADKHGMGNYKVIAQNFEWDSKWGFVKQTMSSFGGTRITSYPMLIDWTGRGGFGFA